MSVTAPDLLGPIVGWRTWLVSWELRGWRLRSPALGTLWPPGRALAAHCRRTRSRTRLRSRAGHAAPAEDCACGIYAAAEPELALRFFAEKPPHLPRWPRVVGQVALWGAVVECEIGWRGELAYPLCLFFPDDWSVRGADWVAKGLAPSYMVPLERMAGRTSSELVAALDAAASR